MVWVCGICEGEQACEVRPVCSGRSGRFSHDYYKGGGVITDTDHLLADLPPKPRCSLACLREAPYIYSRQPRIELSVLHGWYKIATTSFPYANAFKGM